MLSLIVPVASGAALAFLGATLLPWVPLLQPLTPVGAAATVLFVIMPAHSRSALLLMASGMATSALLLGGSFTSALALALALSAVLPPLLRAVGAPSTIRRTFAIGALFALAEIAFPLAVAFPIAAFFRTAAFATIIAAAGNVGAGLLALRVRAPIA